MKGNLVVIRLIIVILCCDGSLPNKELASLFMLAFLQLLLWTSSYYGYFYSNYTAVQWYVLIFYSFPKELDCYILGGGDLQVVILINI